MAELPLSPEKKPDELIFSPLTFWLTDFLDHFDLALYMSLSPLWIRWMCTESSTVLEKTQWFHGLNFAISALVYPLGAVIFSHIAQYRSPMSALRLSVWGFSISTLAMGFIPISSPFFSPWLLATCRFLQCFFARGDRTIAPVYLMANSPKSTVLDRAVVYDVILIAGQWGAQIVSYFLLKTQSDFLWRIPFVIAGIFGCFCAYFRCKSTTHHKQLIKKADPLVPPATQRPPWKWFLALVCMTGPCYLFYTLSFYLITDFVPMITPLSSVDLAGQKIYLSPLDISILLVVYLLLKRRYLCPTTLLGILSRLCFIGIVILIPMFSLIPVFPSLIYVASLRCLLIALGVPYALCFFVLLRQAIPLTDKPYIFIGLAQVLGTILLGHSTCMISLKLYDLFPYAGMPGVYGSLVCGLALWGNGWFKKFIASSQSSS